MSDEPRPDGEFEEGFDAEELDQERTGRPEYREPPRCTKCGSTHIRRSLSEGTVDTLFRLIGRRPFRCRDCRQRFYASRWLLHGHNTE
jgi:hypothetical protein